MRSTVTFPVQDSKILKFCEYMGYKKIKKIEDTTYYEVPVGHHCNLYLNAKRWLQGKFDKNRFIESLRV